MSRITSISEWILRLPLVWGGVACLAFYAFLDQQWISSPLLARYLTSHPVEYVTSALFFVGLAALAMRFFDITGQFASIRRVTLGPIWLGGEPVSECDGQLAKLNELPSATQSSYLARRLREALEFIGRKNSADSIDSELRHLEEQDADRMHAGYSLVRIIVWAIPILGFLGTVIGITLALANLSPQALEKSLTEVMAGLSVAFDTTAQALALTMVLMFIKFGVERMEDRLLATVDARVSEELVGRFQFTGAEDDVNVAAVRRMSEQVVTAVEALASRQAQVWKSSIDETHQQWAEISSSATKLIHESLSSTLRESLLQHAKILDQGVQRHAEALGFNATQLTETLSSNVTQLAETLSSSVTRLADELGANVHQLSDALGANVAHHADTLSRNSDETVSRLRVGLEKLAELLVEALHKHGEVLTASEEELAEENRRHLSEVEAALGEAMVLAADRQEKLIKQSEHLLKEMQVSLVEAADATLRQQEQLVKQGDVLLQVVDATGQVKKLEETLNGNLAALAQAQHFDEMALNLTAAIQMLCARTGTLTSNTVPATQSAPSKSASHAA